MAPGDLGRRLCERRHALDLSIEDLAGRTGLAPSYLRHLEADPWSAVPTASMRLLARALDTTVDDLAGGGLLEPPGHGRPARPGVLDELDVDECHQLISTGGIGRVVMTDDHGPTALPVNFVLADGEVVFRTDRSTRFGRCGGRSVAFEVDHVDDALAEGWSVMIRGRARVVDDEEERKHLEGLDIRPWAGPERDVYVRIAEAEITGRRVRRSPGEADRTGS